jgi:hypothetical protein
VSKYNTPGNIYEGVGELLPGQAYWMISKGRRNGMIVGRNYIKERVRAELSRWKDQYPLEIRRKVVTATVDNDAWLGPKNGMIVEAICRDAFFELVTAEWCIANDVWPFGTKAAPL